MPLPAPTPTPAPDARAFRAALARYPTGVAFLTAAPDRQPAGSIINTLTSVSLDPPLISFCPSRHSLTWSRMRRTRHIAINILAHHHQPFAQRATPAGADRFTDLNWKPAHSGAPLLTDALANLECQLVAEHPAGDHTIVLAHVTTIHIPPATTNPPLIFYASTYATLNTPPHHVP